MSIISFVIGIGILITAIIFAVLHRHNTSKCITCILLGIFFSTIIFVLPTKWIADDKQYINSTLYAILSSVLYGFKALGGRQDIGQIEKIAFSGIMKSIYLYINYFNFFLAPIITSSLILSFFGDTGEKIKYHLKFSKKYYYFSCVSDKTLALAEGIKKGNKNAVLVFCNSKGCDAGLSEKIRKMGGVLLYKTCPSIFPGIRPKDITFYLAEDNEDENINTSIQLVEKYRHNKKHKVTVNAFNHNSSSVQAVEKAGKGRVVLHFIDKVALQCYHLLFQYPLHDAIVEKSGKKVLSVMIIGAGEFGQTMLKTISWCGQLPDAELKIRVFDKSGSQIEEEFFTAAPELRLPQYDIKFIDADVTKDTFVKNIKKYASDATVCILSMGDDMLNVSTANTVYSTFRKQNGFKETPLLLTRMRSVEKVKNLSKSSYIQERNIVLFGDIASVYSSQVIFHTQLEKIGFAVHLSYFGVLDKPKDDKDRIYAVEKYYESVYNRNSSLAVALHIKSKVYCIEQMQKENVNYEEIIEVLACNEHNRWNAFMRSEGYTSATNDQLKAFAPTVKSSLKDRDDLTKLHSCLREWDELDSLSDFYNQLKIDKPRNFKDSDYLIVKAIPQILKYAESENE